VEKLIKRADRASAFLEAVQLAGFSEAEAARFFGRPRGLKGPGVERFFNLRPLPPEKAKEEMLRRFRQLQ